MVKKEKSLKMRPLKVFRGSAALIAHTIFLGGRGGRQILVCPGCQIPWERHCHSASLKLTANICFGLPNFEKLGWGRTLRQVTTYSNKSSELR